MFICPFFVAVSWFSPPFMNSCHIRLTRSTWQRQKTRTKKRNLFKKKKIRNKCPIYLSKSSLSRNTPTARGTAHSRCPSRGYSTPGGGRSRSAHVTFSGNQNLSLQIQAEIEEIIGDQKVLEIGVANSWGNYLSDIWWFNETITLTETFCSDVLSTL